MEDGAPMGKMKKIPCEIAGRIMIKFSPLPENLISKSSALFDWKWKARVIDSSNLRIQSEKSCIHF